MEWIDPVAFYIGSHAVRWYGLSYVFSSFICFYMFYKDFMLHRIMNNINFIDFCLCVLLGIIFGGKIGEALFYHPEWIVDNPLKLLKTWEGGRSFHGGLICVMGSVFIFCKYQKINVLKVYDTMASYTPIFIFNVRIANFINQELPGTITDMPWGVVFPRFDSFVRHPSQIYEAIGEGFLLYIIIAIYAKKYQKHDGMRAVVFLIGYGIIRFLIEFVRMPEKHQGHVFLGMTMGQILCLGMMLAAYLMYLQIHRVKSIEKKFL